MSLEVSKKCFISYSASDDVLVRNFLIPMLDRELNCKYVFNFEQLAQSSSLFEYLARSIKACDIFICVYNRENTFANFEIGVALGDNKPILALIHSDRSYDFPPELRFVNYLNFEKSNLPLFSKNLKKKVVMLRDELIDKTTYALAGKDDKKLIAIQVGTEVSDYELELKFTHEFIDLIKKITKSAKIELADVSKGSLKSLLDIDLKSCAELIEKLIFFIPELQKKKLENLRIEMEVKKMEAEVNDLKTSTMIKQAASFVELLDKYQKLGIHIQIDEKLIITQNSQGLVTIKEPTFLLQ